MQKFIKRRRMPRIILAFLFTLYTMLMPGVAYAENENPTLSVVISGTPQVGATLTANCTTTLNESQLSYQWYSLADPNDTAGVPIQGATSNTYILTANELNKFMTVQAVALVDGTLAANALSTPSSIVISEPAAEPTPTPTPTTIPVPPPAPSPSPSPEPTVTPAPAAPTATGVVINGLPKVGEALTGAYVYDDVNNDIENGSLYQWFRCDSPSDDGALIQGESGKSYTLGTDDIGKYIRFEVIPKNDIEPGVGALAKSDAFGPVAPLQGQISLSEVTITGNTQVGDTLTANYTTNVEDSQFIFQWYSTSSPVEPGDAIQGATGKTYQLQEQDLGKYIKVQVTPVLGDIVQPPRIGCTSETVVSIPLPPEPAAPAATDVFITGNLMVGQTLTGNYTYSDINNDVESNSTYQWYRLNGPNDAGTAIDGATGRTYTTEAADLGKYLKFEVTPKNDVDPATGIAVMSVFFGPISPYIPIPEVSDVHIVGTPQVGITLTAAYTSNVDDSNFTYQWYLSSAAGQQGYAIAGATGKSHLITADEVNQFLTVEVTPVSGVLTGTPVLSGSSDIVIPAPVLPAAPVVTAVNANGNTVIGQTLTGSYIYEDANNDAENGSTYQWYRCDAAGDDGLAIDGATSLTYILVAADVDKYIRFEVTPKNNVDPMAGTPVKSAAVGKVINLNVHPSISGIVRNSVNDAPIAGATINLSYTNFSTVTDSNGYYEFADVPMGTYDLNASQPGYYTRTVNSLPTQGNYGESIVQNMCLTPINVPVQSVTGYVSDTFTIAGLNGIRVTLGDGMTVYTANSYWYWNPGYFHVDNVPVGKSFKMTIGPNAGYKVRNIDGIKAGDYMDVGIINNWAASGTITGRVTDSVTGSPVSGARISAGYGIETITDGSGNYRLENIKEGTFYLQAFKTAYESSTAAVKSINGTTQTQDFKIKPDAAAGSLSGYITDINGNRLNGAKVTIGGQTVLSQRVPGNPTDNNNGWYVIEGLAPGNYTMEVSYDYYHTRKTDSVTIGISGQNQVNMRLTQENIPVVVLSGVVKNTVNGNPIPGAYVSIMDGISVLTDSNGCYTITDVPLSSYDLSASSVGYYSRTINSLPIKGDQGSTITQDIGLTPNNIQVQSISGYIIDAFNSNKIDGARIDIGDGMAVYSSYIPWYCGNGYYRIDNVPIGKSYTIQVIPSAGYKSRSVSGIKAGDSMDFALTSDWAASGTITGKVTDSVTGVPVPGVRIRAGFGYETITDSNGNYMLDNLKEGIYFLMAFKSSYESSSSAVTVTKSVSATQDFAIKQDLGTGSISGYVMDTSGNRLNGAKVTIGGVTVVSQPSPGNPTDNGWYGIQGLAPGNYTIEVSNDYYETRKIDSVIVGVGTSSLINVKITQKNLVTVTLTGIVKNVINGNPIPGAYVNVTDGIQVVTDSSGCYTITNLPIGNYDINASHAGYYDRRINNAPINTDQGSVVTQDIGLTPNNIQVQSISGYITDAYNSARLDGVRIDIGDGMLVYSSYVPWYTGDGYYRIDNVPLGKSYTINVVPNAGYKGRSVSGIIAGNSMDFALANNWAATGTISGKVINTATGAGVAGACIWAGFGVETITDSEGNYKLENIMEGTYYLMAFQSGYESSTAIVDVSANGTSDQNFSIKSDPSAGSINGYVMNYNNNRLNGAKITIDGKTVLSRNAEGSPSDSGWYDIAGILPGDHSIKISLQGYDSIVTTVHVYPSSAFQYIWYLQPASNTTEDLDSDQITITNNPTGSDDVVRVDNVNAGDVVNVYDSLAGGTFLGSAAAAGTSVLVKIPQIGLTAGTLYVSLTNPGKYESARTPKAFEGEIALGGKSEKPMQSSIIVCNNSAGTSDTITVNNLLGGDVVKVYDSAVSGNLLCTGTVADGETSITLSVDQLPGISFGSVYVTVTNTMMTESDRTQKTYLFYGDVNGDGSLTNSDLILVRRYFANVVKTLPNILAADVNGDGSLTNIDLILIRRYFANVITKFPVQP